MGDRPALRRCIGIPPEEFAAAYWGKAPLLSPAGDPPGRDVTDLLDLDAVDELVSRRGLRTPFVRMAKDGAVVDASRFTRSGGAGAEVSDQVDPDRVLALFADGATLVLQGLHRTWPPLVQHAAALSHELGHPVQVNAYITPPQSTGFSPHYDVHDVFVLQVAGEKRWTIHAPVVEAPLRDQPWTGRRRTVTQAAAGDPVMDTVLRPGDALYLPRGWLHSAQALGQTSAHLTIGVHPVTRYAVVEQLAAMAGQDPALRRSLPLGLEVADPTGPAADEVRETVEALVSWLRSADPAEVVDRLRAQMWSAVRPSPVAPVAQASAARTLRAGDRVRLRPQLRWRLLDDGELGCRLLLTGKTLTLPAGTAAALGVLLCGEPRAVGSLPGLDADDQIVLVRRLLCEAVLVPVTP